MWLISSLEKVLSYFRSELLNRDGLDRRKMFQIDQGTRKFLGDSWNQIVMKDLKTSASVVIPKSNWSAGPSGGFMVVIVNPDC